MRRAMSGLTLVEVLVALLLLTTALLPAIYGVARSIGITRRGTARGQGALVMLTRMAALERNAAGTDPSCALLASGLSDSSRVHETWAVSGTGALRTVTLRVRVDLPGGPLEDSSVVRVRCD